MTEFLRLSCIEIRPGHDLYVIFGINITRDISKLSQISLLNVTAREIMCNNFEISLVVFMPNITTNHAITSTNTIACKISYLIASTTLWLLIFKKIFHTFVNIN